MTRSTLYQIMLALCVLLAAVLREAAACKCAPPQPLQCKEDIVVLVKVVSEIKATCKLPPGQGDATPDGLGTVLYPVKVRCAATGSRAPAQDRAGTS
jgi:hypothetical protein